MRVQRLGDGPHRLSDGQGAQQVRGRLGGDVQAPSSATRLLGRLAVAGLIRRTRLRADRRSLRVALSPAGRDLVAEVTRQRRAEVERLFAALPAERHALVITALQAISEAAGETPAGDLDVGLGWY